MNRTVYAAIDPKCNCVVGIMEVDVQKRFLKDSLGEWAEEGLTIQKMESDEAFDRMASYGPKTCARHQPKPEQKRVPQ